MYRFGLWRGNSIPSLSPSSTSNWILLLVVEHFFSSFVVKRHLQVFTVHDKPSTVFCYNSKDSVWPALLGLSEYLLSLGVFFHTLYLLAFPCPTPTPPLYVFPHLTCPLYTFPLPCMSPIHVPFPHMLLRFFLFCFVYLCLFIIFRSESWCCCFDSLLLDSYHCHTIDS